MKWILKAIWLDAGVMAAFVLGQEWGNALLLNAALFLLWALAALLIIGGLCWTAYEKEIDMTQKHYDRYRSDVWVYYDWTSDLAILLIVAAYGHFWLAGFLLVGKILLKPQIVNSAREAK